MVWKAVQESGVCVGVTVGVAVGVACAGYVAK